MSYIHIIIKKKSSSKPEVVIQDSNLEYAKKIFVAPIRKGNEVIIKGNIYRPNELEHIRIISTDSKLWDVIDAENEKYFAENRRLNRDSALVVVGSGITNDYEIQNIGNDITEEVLSKISPISLGKIFLNPWLITILLAAA